MKRSVRWFRFFLATSLFLVYGTILAAGAIAGARGALDGKVFIVEKGEKGKKSDGKDAFIFRNGKFLSRHCQKYYGFSEGPYTTGKDGNTITFVADIRSQSDGTIHWEGTVKGNQLDVRYTWTGKKQKWYQAEAKLTEHWARSVTTWATEDPGPPGGGKTSHLLDGKIFLVQTGAKGKKPDHDDYLIFQNGSFVSSDCVESDFRESTYSVTPHGDGIRFRAETASPTHGTMIWDGTVRGDVMDATVRWIHGRWYWTIDRMYWYRGRLLE